MVALFIAPQPAAWGATYHVRADGTAGKPFATSCFSPETAMNFNSPRTIWESFSPGDTIVLCSEGGEFRGELNVVSNGTAGSPITYDGRGSAVILASELMDDWRNGGGNVYVASLSVQPQQVFVNSVFGDRKSNRGELTGNLDWYWEANQLYLFSSTGDPGVVYEYPGVEATIRQSCVDLTGNHVVISGITVRHANRNGIGAWNSGSHVTIKNCLAEWNWVKGIGLEGDTLSENITIEDNIARFNGGGGIGIAGPGRNSTIRRNACYSNGKFQKGEFDYYFQWTFGIAFWERNGLQEGFEIYENLSYDNGRGHEGDFGGRGVGIWLDTVQSNPANPTLVHHNLVHDNKGIGIFVELSSNTRVYGNVLYGNATNTGGTIQYGNASIAIDARVDTVSIAENNYVYNNTVYGGRYGIKVTSYGVGDCLVRNNIIKNNIVVNASEHNLYSNFGGDNDGTYGSGNIYEYNNLGAESDNFIHWSGTDYDTYAAWESAYGEPSHSIEGDPQLAGTSKNSLYLTASSPCRDAGANLGPAYDEGLLESSVWNDSVLTTDQDLHGDGWEVGAYVTPTSPRASSRRVHP